MKKSIQDTNISVAGTDNPMNTICPNVLTAGFQEVLAFSSYTAPVYTGVFILNSRKGHKLDTYQLVYITKGSGELELDEKKYFINEGSVFIVYPYQWHKFRPSTDTGWKEYYIRFDGLESAKWVENSVLGNGKQIFNIGVNRDFVSLFSTAIEFVKSREMNKQPFESGILFDILELLVVLIHESDTRHTNQE